MVERVAVAMAVVVREEEATAAPQKAVPCDDSNELAGKSARLETQVAGLRETNHELEEEKRSLISSVQQMLHGNKANELHEELEKCHADLLAKADGVKDAKAAGEKALEQLRSENSALAEAVETCQKSQMAVAASTTTQAVASETATAVVCEKKLREVQAQWAADRTDATRVTDTVNMLTRENEDLKQKVGKFAHG